MLNNCVQHHQSQRTSIPQTKDEVSRRLCLLNVCLLTLFCSFLSLTSIFLFKPLLSLKVKHPQRCKCRWSTETDEWEWLYGIVMTDGNPSVLDIHRSSSVFQQEALKLYYMLCFYCVTRCFSSNIRSLKLTFSWVMLFCLLFDLSLVQ